MIFAVTRTADGNTEYVHGWHNVLNSLATLNNVVGEAAEATISGTALSDEEWEALPAFEGW